RRARQRDVGSWRGRARAPCRARSGARTRRRHRLEARRRVRDRDPVARVLLRGRRLMSTVDIPQYLRLQADGCRRLGSPFYDTLLQHAADDVAAGGPIADVFAGYPHEPILSAMALRLMGAVHRLVLEGRAPTLTAHYPSAGGDGDGARAWPVFRT